MMTTDDRRADLARIHILAEQLGMDTMDKHPASEYRSTLFAVGGPTARHGEEISAGFLDHVGRRRVVAHLAQLARARGIKQKQPPIGKAGRPTPAPDRAPMVRKIRAMLAEAGRPDSYGDRLSKTMFHVEFYEWCAPDQLRRVIAALCYDRGRRAAREARAAESAADGRR
jgi:phage gp16-like protein